MASIIRRGVAVLLLASVVGCDGRGAGRSETNDPRLRTFASAAAMKQYLRDQVSNNANRGGGIFFNLGISSPLAAAAEDDATAGEGGFSETNLQEAGVDESDRVKTDGEYLYVATDNEVRIIRANGVDPMAQIAEVPLAGVTALYLRGDRLVAITPGGYYYYGGAEPGIAVDAVAGSNGSQDTIVTIINIADRAAPVVEASLTFEASLVSSRMIENRAHVVMTTYPDLPYEPAAVDARSLDDIIPDHTVQVGGQTMQDGNVAEWNEFLYPVDPDGVGMTIVASFDITDPDATLETTAIVANAGAIYASTEALYLTDTAYTWWSDLRETTDVYKFDLTGGSAQYVTSGSVPGRVLNQFSLGEKDGYLRIATTRSSTFSFDGVESPSNNAVFVMNVVGDTLGVVGQVEGIAPGESIYAARFIGDRGFLVTFKKIDPLFTLDLSNPTAPAIVGELKVPGYSDYIHPLGDDHLLTIGKDAEDVGDFAWYQGVQLSVFDVTDFTKPGLADKEILGSRGTESEALYEHKAFNYYAPLELLAIPVHLFEGSGGGSDYGTPTFAGVYVFHVTPTDGLEYRGRVATNNAAYYSMDWTRTVFIDGDLYIVTGDSVQALPSGDLAAAAEVLPLN